jgi:sarcosine oxidase, subunit delta
MPLALPCPNCGGRPTEEFAFGGEFPRVPDHVTDPHEADFHRVWLYDNPDGETTERWFHTAGCRRWFTLRRDAHTDRPLTDLA